MKNSPPKIRQSHRGVALVIVLGLLVIIVGLTVTFLSRVTVERSASASYAANATTRQFADTVVNLVEGQIRRASTLGGNVAWISQPGMIRTFGSGSSGSYSASANALLNFKLYSAPDMITNSSDFSGDRPPANWAEKPGLWTDLNSPVRAIYPILTPQPSTDGAEEFSLASSVPGSTTEQPVPMPVRWLYVLENGNIVAPSSSGNTITVDGASNSPIVGRIAFWTDDETCKININTASEGTFWDVPRANSDEEKALAKFQPAQKEFQRYPGHPAMTSLGAALPFLSTSQIYDIVPRVIGGGSSGGTASPSGALVPDSDRLYASVDELAFNADRGSNSLTQKQLEEARFFLTASSRAPEVTLFNTPRVAIWPIDANTTDEYRTAFDRLIAFCATINEQPYYFQRSDPKSATNDYDTIERNRQLYRYLQKLTSAPFPGFGGGTFAKKFEESEDERDQILTEIFDYIRTTNLDDSGLAHNRRFSERAMVEDTESPVWKNPGFGQVTPIRIGTTQGFGRFPVITEAGIHFIATADGKKADGTLGDASVGNDTANKTLGNTLLTTTQRRIEALFFLETFVPGQGWPPFTAAYSVRIRGLNQLKINGTSLGFPADDTDLSRITGSSTFYGRSWGGSSSHLTSLYGARLPARGAMPADSNSGDPDVDLNRYPFVSIPITVDISAGTMNFTGGTLTIDVYRRTSSTGTGYSASDVPVNSYTIEIPGYITLPIPSLVTTGTSAEPGSSTPATVKENWWTFSRDGCGLANQGRVSFAGRKSSVDLAGTPFRAEDVVRTVVPTHSDFRLLGASQSIPAGAFQEHPSYRSAQNLAHSLVESRGSNMFLGVSLASSLLAPGVSYEVGSKPDVAVSHANAASGDWDNGISITPDGPYINKPDEGNSKGLGDGKTPYFDDAHLYENSGQAMFSPNRQVPSAGMFGSLSSGVRANVPYRTLLFRPQSGHFGSTETPRDHLWTDLFWMPIVEPYAISEPFSTAGKINMNYQIEPFDYIHRATGLAALLRSEKIMAIPNGNGNNYKTGAAATVFRKAINISETLKQFEAKFSAGEVFHSASEIMDLHLVPTGSTLGNMDTFWAGYKLTGDNSRERPYTNLLGRLTTKSNTYTVHYRVQSLKKSSATAAGQWDESRDKITGEFRGSTTIERYINPNDKTIPSYGNSLTPLDEEPLSNFYKWRVVNTRQFAP